MDVASETAVTAMKSSGVSIETREAFFRCLADVQRSTSAAYAHVPADVQKQIGILVFDRKEELFEQLQSLTIRDDRTVAAVELPARNDTWQPILEFIARPEICLEHFVRLMLSFSMIRRAACGAEPYVLDWRFGSLLNHFRRRRTFGLRELARAFQSVGLDESMLARQQLWRSPDKAFPWESEALWPYWAGHLDLLDQALQPGEDYVIASHRQHAFSILARFPEPPPQFAERLWDFAFGSKSERAEAQNALGNGPTVLQRLLLEIASAKSSCRTIAAEWLGRLGNPAAIEPLMAAVRLEKEVEPRGAMLIALESLGAPIEALLDRAALVREAVTGLSEGIPPELHWFPISDLPRVHWNGTEAALPLEIPQWWIVESFKLKNPEPGPLLRCYCAALESGERQALGRFVLEAWIAQEAYTRKGPIALTCKGILAVAAACCGGEVASAAGRYLAEWPRERAGQCRALVQMLAWIDHPATTQLLLAVSSRFKPATIQEEARRLSLNLARRKGWTLDQMADRAIPSAGLNEKGELRLDYGSRVFTARLNKQMEFVLRDDTGTVIKTLPSPRKADDESLAAESKRAFSAAKKELKAIQRIQRDRLYEAMCIQRTWSFEDWTTFLHHHPVARYLCQRLVWYALRGNHPPLFFRSLDDGSLTDVEDNRVQVPAESRIGLAHDSVMLPEVSRAWRQHLADYEVDPLFPQFGLHGFSLAPAQKQEVVMSDFRGHVIDSFTLRGQATKLGYVRGAAEDGGWFYEYIRTFSTMGTMAVIAFTGNAMPEENRKVALTELYFIRVNEAEQSLFGGPLRMPLAEVPPVLLSECWNHLRQIAGAGFGFDPNWEKNTQM